MKLWEGLTDAAVDPSADGFNSSIGFDKRLYREDITGSIVHAQMLAHCNIITDGEAALIAEGLSGILEDIESGKLAIDLTQEDIHTFVEQTLTARIGETGKKLHTARSRNDQVALDMRLWCRQTTDGIISQLKELIGAICDKAEQYKTAIMPGYTHMQRAQPVTFGHHVLAYAMMFLRDIGRLKDCSARANVSVIGCCALAGTTYNTDRAYEADALGFDFVCMNSIDGVSDRDFLIELLSALSVIMMHLSRFSEELILWSGSEFSFVKLSDAYTTGSSIMPQKKNPDMAELCRGKTGRVYGDLFALLTVMKGLPLAYNKDMQEDKESVFDAADTVCACLQVFTGMIKTLNADTDAMSAAAKKGFINATDLADYFTGKGLPFRDAYKLCGKIVSYCIKQNKVLEDMSVDEYKSFYPYADKDVYAAVDLKNCVYRRISAGGTSPDSVSVQIEYLKNEIK